MITISCDKFAKRLTIFGFLNDFYVSTLLGDSSAPNSFIKQMQKACYVISFVLREKQAIFID